MSDEEAFSTGEQRASTSTRGASAQGVPPSSRTQGAPRGIPLPPPFHNDGRESFQLWARRYEVIQEARYKDSGVDMNTVLAAELPTRLPPELFIVWDNLPQETQDSYTEAKKHLQTAFGQKDVIASFQTFPNARHRLPNEAMEVYAADVCRLVKEAFPDFEHNASEYMKMSRFIAGLDQELQVKCHERGVKTFTEAFQVASQAERARQAARLVMPVSSPNVRVRPQRSPSPYGRSPDRDAKGWSSGYRHSPSRYSRSNHSPEHYSPQRTRHHQDHTRREPDRYRQPYRDTHYSDHAFSPYEEKRGRQPSPSRPYYDSHRRSPSPYAKHVSFQEYGDQGQTRQPKDWDSQYPTKSGYKDHGRFPQGNGR